MPGPRSILGAYTVGEWGTCIPVVGWVYEFPQKYFNLVMATETGGTHPTGMFSYILAEEPSLTSLVYGSGRVPIGFS